MNCATNFAIIKNHIRTKYLLNSSSSLFFYSASGHQSPHDLFVSMIAQHTSKIITMGTWRKIVATQISESNLSSKEQKKITPCNATFGRNCSRILHTAKYF